MDLFFQIWPGISGGELFLLKNVSFIDVNVKAKYISTTTDNPHAYVFYNHQWHLYPPIKLY